MFSTYPALIGDEYLTRVGPNHPELYYNGLHPVARMVSLLGKSKGDSQARWTQIVAAYLGPLNDSITPWVTSTVHDLLRPEAVYLPIVADALQDAGMPEDHWVLARCRDESVPFIPNEWLYRQTK